MVSDPSPCFQPEAQPGTEKKLACVFQVCKLDCHSRGDNCGGRYEASVGETPGAMLDTASAASQGSHTLNSGEGAQLGSMLGKEGAGTSHSLNTSHLQPRPVSSSSCLLFSSFIAWGVSGTSLQRSLVVALGEVVEGYATHLS